MEKISKLFNLKLEGSKRFKKILHQDKEVSNNTTSWQKVLEDASITNMTYLKRMNLHKLKLLTQNTMIKSSDSYVERHN